jgi:formiminotetrahydrofolate cyclodeaminase
MLSDVCVGRMMAATAVRGALANVSVNLESVTDATFDSHVRSEVLSLESRIDESSAATGR